MTVDNVERKVARTMEASSSAAYPELGADATSFGLPWTKRLFDVAVTATLLPAQLALLFLICLTVVLDSGWPPLIKQSRIGLHGRTFEMWKVRTMVQGADRLRHQLMALNEAPFPAFKLRSDPRVTRVGALLRKTSLDELPQLWNVLSGDMSLVGPRPPLPDEVAHYDSFARQRLFVRPGLTCTWQIESRHRNQEITFSEWVRMDVEYIQTWSLVGDLRLLVRTVVELLRLRGS